VSHWVKCERGSEWDMQDSAAEAAHRAEHPELHKVLDIKVTALRASGARALGDIDRSAAPPLIVDRISPDGHTMLFGPGNAGKGLVACSWVRQHVDDNGRVLILDFEDHPEEWARRLYGLGGVDMFLDTPIRHISPLRNGKVDWDVLAKAAGEHEATLIVVDSVAYAIPGADPSEPQAATTYSKLIQPFGVPVLSLAHMNRAGDDRYPFGSVFWHAGARMTWSLVPDGQKGSKLTNRKHNNYEWRGAYMVTADWLDDIPRDVHERSYSVSVAERIESVLKGGPATVDVIVAAMSTDGEGEPVKKNTIVQALRRGIMSNPKRFTVDGEEWSNV
jgi:hypothetical protein